MIRRARPEDAEGINRLRKQVNDLHVEGRPDIFRSGFGAALQEHVNAYLESETNYAVVEEEDGRILGMALVDYIDRPESPYNLARKFVHVAEIGVEESCRKKGVGHRLMGYVKADAKEKGFPRIELDVWAFNDALAFYEREGFTVFRRFLEMEVQ